MKDRESNILFLHEIQQTTILVLSKTTLEVEKTMLKREHSLECLQDS